MLKDNISLNKNRLSVAVKAALLASLITSSMSMATIQFTDIANDESVGIDYQRIESPRNQIMDIYKQNGAVLSMQDVPLTPGQSRGVPGVAIFDYDQDGDLDLYVTNGPGRANSLYASQLNETGRLTFIDKALEAGVAAISQDSNGVCFADIDNDGDQDLYVLGASQVNRLFENQADGTFVNISDSSATGQVSRNSLGCSFGDVNNDGLVDLLVGNLYHSFDNRLALMVPGFEHLKEHDKLFINKGNNIFEDKSVESGLEAVLGASWAIAMVDYDQDGDMDIVSADDQGTRLPAEVGGEDFGYVRVLQNDGSGHFIDVTEAVGTNIAGDWMGLSFADFNSDGNLDIFVTNIGDYLALAVGGAIGFPLAKNQWSSRWLLGQDDGTFSDPKLGDLGASPFGWGTSAADYDNDGDTDIVFHGGADMGVLVDATNPGVILNNDGEANFSRDQMALANSTNHSRRSVQGMAMADLNQDGFVDIVSASSMDWPEPLPLAPMVPEQALLGGAFDESVYIMPTFIPLDPANPFAGFSYSQLEGIDGTLSIEINSADNDNRSVTFELKGSKSILANGSVNRDGIGAIVSFTPHSGKTVIKPVVSGGSHASADGLALVFGLSSAKKGTLDILWPGGNKNRLYNVKAGQSLIIPEIPCSYEAKVKISEYRRCVETALDELQKNDTSYSKKFTQQLLQSAMRAFEASESNR